MSHRLMEVNELPRPRTSAAAIASLVCGLLGCVPFLTGLAALILGIVGVKTTRDPMITGRGMAIAGLVLGGLNLAGWTLFVVFFAAGLVVLTKTAEPARLTAEQFTRDLSEGKIEAALASSAEGMDRAKLADLAERMKPWGTFRSLRITSYNIKEANGTVEFTFGGVATFATETKKFTTTLHKEGTTYKLEKFDFP
jgi:Domain of unknown function (DUF4190)